MRFVKMPRADQSALFRCVCKDIYRLAEPLQVLVLGIGFLLYQRNCHVPGCVEGTSPLSVELRVLCTCTDFAPELLSGYLPADLNSPGCKFMTKLVTVRVINGRISDHRCFQWASSNPDSPSDGPRHALQPFRSFLAFRHVTSFCVTVSRPDK